MRAIAIQVLGTFEQIIAYFILVAVFFLGLTVAGLFVSRIRTPERGVSPETSRPRVAAAVFLTMVLLLLVLLVARNPRQPALGGLAVLAGLPLYQFARRKEEDLGAQVPAP